MCSVICVVSTERTYDEITENLDLFFFCVFFVTGDYSNQHPPIQKHSLVPLFFLTLPVFWF